jgi:prepilin-type N-terminal cleavage/methylation domain-containing protein
MKTAAAASRRPRGMVIMEMVVAIAIFGIAVTGLMQAIVQVSKSAVMTRSELRMILRLQSELNKYSKWPRIQEFEGPAIETGPDELGVRTKTTITKLEDIQNMEQQPLQDMYEIIVTASSDPFDTGEIVEVSASTVRYARLYSVTGAAAGQPATPTPQP